MTKSEAALLSALSEWAIDAYGGEPFPFDGKAFDVLLGKLSERNISVKCGQGHETHCVHWFDAQPCCDCDAEVIRGMVADDCCWCQSHGYVPGQQLNHYGEPING